MVLTIIGLGVAGIDCFESIRDSSELIFQEINLVEKVPQKLDLVSINGMHLRAKVNKFQSLEQITGNLGVVVLAVSPYEMPFLITQLSSREYDSLVIEKPGPLPFNERIYSNIMSMNNSVFACHQRQYSDHFRWANEQIMQGRLGDIEIASVTLGKWDFLTAGTHWMALCHLLFGQPMLLEGVVNYQEALESKYGYPKENSASFFSMHNSGVYVHWRIGENYGQRSDLRIMGTLSHMDIKYHPDKLVVLYNLESSYSTNAYGNPRLELLKAAKMKESPQIGCRLEDMMHYVQLYLGLSKYSNSRLLNQNHSEYMEDMI